MPDQSHHIDTRGESAAYNVCMSEPLFYCAELSADRVTLDERESHHALHSLRMRPGNRVALFDGRGGIAQGVLRETDPANAADRRARPKRQRNATVDITHVKRVDPPPLRLTLIVAGCKGPRLTWMVEKCTELGVTRLLLTEFERSVVHVGPGHVEKLQRTAIEACKQCGRVWLPTIEAGRSLQDALRTATAQGALLVAEPADNAEPLSTWLHAHKTTAADLTAIVGPEGGLTPSELDFLKASGAATVRLADHILRVETAAIAVAANWAASPLRA